MERGIYMKILSKITLLLAFVCTLFIMNPIDVEAATGRIIFADPTVAAGEQFDLTVKVVSYEGTMDAVSVNLKYDSSKIEFLSGTNSTGGDGTIKISATATSTENIYTLKFRALKKGNTSVTVASQTIKTSGDDVFTIQEGSAAIKVEGGTEVEASTSSAESSDDVAEEEDDSVIQIEGIVYEMSQNYLESEIPAGYTKEVLTIRGESISVIKGDTSGIILVYLEAPGQQIVENEYGYTPKGRFFRFDEETAKFSPYVQIMVSDSTYIIFLTEDYEVELPTQYIPTTMTADGFNFPAWQDTQLDGYYLVYVVNSKGVRELYRYDANDQSYQRYEMPPEPENPNKVSNATLQKVIDTIADNLIVILLIIGLLLFLLFVLTITFGVKLRNRNKEIDDIYEEGVTAYSNTAFNDSREEQYRSNDAFSDFEDEEDFEEDWDDDFEIELDDTRENVHEDMLDDGFTQEFDITMEDDIFKNDGFIDYRGGNAPVENASGYGSFKQSEFDISNGNIGTYSKYQADDDDDIEFIEI